MSTHIIEFNSVFSQVINQGLKLDDELKATLILCSLPESWDTFRTSTSNSNAILLFADVESALLQEEMNRKNNAVGKSNALNARSRSKTRGKDTERERSKSRSKKDLVCNYCGKKEHVEKRCFQKKNDERDKEGKAQSKSKGKEKEELHVTYVSDSDSGREVCFTSSLEAHTLHAGNGSDMHSWIIDSGASFHVTPYKIGRAHV